VSDSISDNDRLPAPSSRRRPGPSTSKVSWASPPLDSGLRRNDEHEADW